MLSASLLFLVLFQSAQDIRPLPLFSTLRIPLRELGCFNQRRATLVVACAAVAAVTACATARTPAPLVDAAAGVRTARARWNAALIARDSVTLDQLVEDSAVQVSTRVTRVGRAGFLRVFLENMTARPEFRLTYEPVQVTGCEQPTCAVVTESGTWNEAWRESGEPTEVGGTYYAIWRRDGAGHWRIRSEAFATLRCRGSRYCGS
jgi:ketosteroid isomerase-like protein